MAFLEISFIIQKPDYRTKILRWLSATYKILKIIKNVLKSQKKYLRGKMKDTKISICTM